MLFSWSNAKVKATVTMGILLLPLHKHSVYAAKVIDNEQRLVVNRPWNKCSIIFTLKIGELHLLLYTKMWHSALLYPNSVELRCFLMITSFLCLKSAVLLMSDRKIQPSAAFTFAFDLVIFVLHKLQQNNHFKLKFLLG